MNHRLFGLGASLFLLISTQALAVGFGEIILHSRIGEPLRAEVPILGGSGEPLRASCFSLIPVKDADLPAVNSAHTRLVSDGQSLKLVITGSRPIAEPVFMISLRATCGIDLQRDFVLMPSAPQAGASVVGGGLGEPSARVRSRKMSGYQEFAAREGDTLASIAESRAPNSLARQHRLLARLQRANPELEAEQQLADGTIVRMPKERLPMAVEDNVAPAEFPAQPETPRRVRKPVPVAPAKPPVGDRLVLSPATDDLKPGEVASPQMAALNESEERLLRMETSLTHLSAELDKMEEAMRLGAAMQAARHDLQMAQSLQTPVVEAGLLKTPPPPTPTNEGADYGNWLAFLGSALAGGGVAAGLAHLLSRRQQRRAGKQTLSELTRDVA